MSFISNGFGDLFFCKTNVDTTKHFIDKMFKSLSKPRKKVI